MFLKCILLCALRKLHLACVLAMKKLSFLLLPFIVALVVLSMVVRDSISPVSQDSSSKSFVIPKGYDASQIGQKLQEEGLIKSALAFKIYVQLTNQAGKIKAGQYLLGSNSSLSQIVSALVRGPSEVWVTVPEGLRSEEVALKAADSLGISSKAKIKFIDDFLTEAKGMEGYLFPDSYLFPRDASASAVVLRMRSVFDSKTSGISDSGISTKTLILASILERETRTDQERPIVAGILLKRLNAGWPLQVDASVQYALGTIRCSKNVYSKCDWWPNLARGELDVRSAYNTYLYTGLPPAPIANPGISSIRAALNPQETDYWFYLHDSEGGIHYARTIEEHEENINKYLR